MFGAFQVGPFQPNFQQGDVAPIVLPEGGGGGKIQRPKKALERVYYRREKLELLYKQFEPSENISKQLVKATKTVVKAMLAELPPAGKVELETVLLPFMVNLPQIRGIASPPRIDWGRLLCDNGAIPSILGIYDTYSDLEDREFMELMLLL